MGVHFEEENSILVGCKCFHDQRNRQLSRSPRSVTEISCTFKPVFNFDNKIDLTDSGLAKAKSVRYNARKERGEIPSKEAVANMDPYRWYA
jgi:hypothetical protein